jgi:Domain of unknown function (DUF6817)
MGARPALCDAALLHSVSGTHAYHLAIVDESARARRQALIGDEAEEIAHQFGRMHSNHLSYNAEPGCRPGPSSATPTPGRR